MIKLWTIILFVILGGYSIAQEPVVYRAYDASNVRIYPDFEIDIIKFYPDNAVTGRIKCKSGVGIWLTAPFFMQENKPEDLKLTTDELAAIMTEKYNLTDGRRVFIQDGYAELYIFCSANRIAVADLAGHYMLYTYKGDELQTILYIGFNGRQPQVMKVKKYVAKREIQEEQSQ